MIRPIDIFANIFKEISVLNSKAVGTFKAFGFTNKKTITIKSASRSQNYGVLIIATNNSNESYPLKFNASPILNKTIGKVSAISEDEVTIVITLPETMTHGVILAGGSISNATFTTN